MAKEGGAEREEQVAEALALKAAGRSEGEEAEFEFTQLLKKLRTSFQNQRVWEIASSKILLTEENQYRLIHPDSQWVHLWDAMVLLLVLYNAFALPVVVAFQPIQPVAWVAFDYGVDVVFLLDLAKNFRTAYVNAENELVQDTWAIAHRYARSWFAVDLLATIPFELFVALGTGASLLSGRGGADAETTVRLISALKSIRLLRLGRFAKIADKWRFGNVWSILRQYVGIVLLAHWLACGWYLTVTGSDEGENWLTSQGLEDTSSNEQYIASMLAATLMLFRTLGHPPVTRDEKLYLLCAVLVGAAVHATIFGQVAHLVSSLSSRESSYRQRMRQLYDRMRYFGLPGGLQERVSIYYETLWRRHHITDTQDMMSFTTSLSEPLQLEVNLFLNREMVQRVPMFKDCHASVIVQVVQSLTTHFFMPGDYVVRAGEMGSHMFFIRDGVCQVLVARAKTPAQLEAEAVAAEEAAIAAAAQSKRTPLRVLADRLATCGCPCIPASGLAGGMGGGPAADDVRGMELPPAQGSGSPSGSPAGGDANPMALDRKESSAGHEAQSTSSDGMQVLPSLNADEELMVVKTLEPGDFFGEVSLLFRVKRTATICAARYSDLASLDAASFERILETNPDFAAKLEEGFQQYLSLSGGGAASGGDSDSDSTATLQSPELGPGRFSLGAPASPPSTSKGGRGGGRSSSLIKRSTSVNVGQRMDGKEALAIASQLFGGGPPVPVAEQGADLVRSASTPAAAGESKQQPQGTGLGRAGSNPPPPPPGSSPHIPPASPPTRPIPMVKAASAFSFDGSDEGEGEEGGESMAAPPPIRVSPSHTAVSPVLSHAAKSGGSLSRSPSARVRREAAAALQAADPADLWSAKVTTRELSEDRGSGRKRPPALTGLGGSSRGITPPASARAASDDSTPTAPLEPLTPGRASLMAKRNKDRGRGHGRSSVQFQLGGREDGTPSLSPARRGSFVAEMQAQAKKERSRRNTAITTLKRRGTGTPADFSVTATEGGGSVMSMGEGAWEEALADAVAARVTAAVTRSVGDMLAVWGAQQDAKLSSLAKQVAALGQGEEEGATGVADTPRADTPAAVGFGVDSPPSPSTAASLLATQVAAMRTEHGENLATLALRLEGFAASLHDRLDTLHAANSDVAVAVDGLATGDRGYARRSSVFNKAAVVV